MPQKSPYRMQRINRTVLEVLSEALMNDIKDPRIGLVTITQVRTTNDLSYAKVYYTVMGDDAARHECEKGLVSAKNYLRGLLGQELKVRRPPELRFVFDDSIDRSMRIEETLRSVAPAPEPTDEEPASDDSSSQ